MMSVSRELSPPFDDTVQLSSMEVTVSDEDQLVERDLDVKQHTPGLTQDTDMPDVAMRTESGEPISNGRGYAIVAILFSINLLNYMDRFTIAGELLISQSLFTSV